MKTKHILTALALPTMFAACTADDIEGLNNGMQQQPERALLSENFVLNIENGVESRYQVNGTTGLEFLFEAGDSIGANCIDEPKWDGTAWEEDPADWNILPYVNPALPFVNDGTDQWKSAGRPGEGNYLFTNPYNPKDGGRLAAKFELPIVVQYDSKNPNAHIEAYNKAVAADVLYEGDMASNISLKNLYTYPKIRFHFNKNLDVTKVTKVVLAKGTAENPGFIYQGGLDHIRIVDMFDQDNIDAFLKADKKRTEADYWNQFQTSDFIVDAKNDGDWTGTPALASYAPAAKTQYFFYEMDEKVESNKLEVRLMLPSISDFTSVDPTEVITIYVCTDKGVASMTLEGKNIAWNEDKTLTEQKVQALWRNKANTLNAKEFEKLEAAMPQFGNIVTTADDWNKLVEKYGHLKKYAADTKEKDENGNALKFEVSILSNKFAFTSELEMPTVAEFKIKNDVNVEGDVTLKNIKMVGGKLIVKKNATLTTDATLDAPTVEVKEGGNLVFAAEYNEDEELEAYTKVKTVNNYGTVTVPVGVEATFALNNACKNAVLNVGAAASRAAEVADAVANLSGSNYGIINNYSVINASGLTNNAPVEKNGEEETGYEWDTEEFVWNAAPAINNFGKFNAKGSVKNYGLFVNENVLTSNFVGAAEFINGTAENQKNKYQGTLEIKAGAETYIDSNEGGMIILAELTPEKGLTIYQARKDSEYATVKQGTIEYTLTEKPTAALSLKESLVNKLIANCDVEISETFTYTTGTGASATTTVCALPVLEVTDGIVTLAARTAGATAGTYNYPAKIAKLIVNGEVEIDGEYYSPMISSLEVNAGGVFGIPAESMLQIALNNITTKSKDTKKDLAAGLVSVVGTLEFTEIHERNEVGVTTWPKGGDGKYTSADFVGTNGVARNIEINKDAEVKCAAKTTPAVDNGQVVNREVTLTTDYLGDVFATTEWKAKDGNDTYTLTIKSTINMSSEIKKDYTDGTTKYEGKTNLDMVSILTGAKEVILEGGSIEGLKKGSAVTALTKLTVKGESSIEGSKNVDILKVNELTVEAGAKFDIVKGYLVVNETAVEGRGNEKITIEGVYTGKLIAYNADSEILYWDMTNSVWTKTASEAIDYSEATVNAATAENLAWAVENGVGNITLTNNITLTEKLDVTKDLVIDLNGQKISHAGGTIFNINDADVVINGEGKVESKQDANLIIVGGSKGKLTINDGHYVGTIANMTGGKIEINGGYFEAYQDGKNYHNDFCCLNRSEMSDPDGDIIVVKGGTFKNWNPAYHHSEGTVGSYVASGYKVTVWNVTKQCGDYEYNGKKVSEQPYDGNDWTDHIEYTVELAK